MMASLRWTRNSVSNSQKSRVEREIFLPTLENREKEKYAFFKISKIEGRKRNENIHFSRLREKFLFLLSIFFKRSRCLVLVLLGVSIEGPETGECLQSSHCSIWQVAEQTLCQWQQSAPRLLRAEEMFSILAARPRFLLFFLLQGASVVILALSGLCLDWRAECLNGQKDPTHVLLILWVQF